MTTYGSFNEGLVPFYTTQFTANLELLLQQRSSLFRGKIREGAHVGKMASPINQVGAVAVKGVQGVYSPITPQQTQLARRWVFPSPYDVTQMEDRFQEDETIIDPKGMYVEAAAAAFGRQWDDTIIAAATGTAQIGVDASGLTTETFSTSNFQIAQNFASSANNGLTVAKLIEARRILRHYHNDLETDSLILGIGSQQESDLLNLVQVVSTEFNDRPVLTDGRVTRFLGFDIIVTERMTQTTASSVRGVLVAVKSGLYLGLWKDLMTRIDERKDLTSYPWQIYSQGMHGATRLQAGKVVQILCADTTGADITP